ncbi:hypothetical protein AB0F30_33315 [Streptomyces sp. NPDC029006]|uniref:hypothetical protein n=1 Tax=Streptomyces sp. NPDC029006 TaxID=3155467 RepID=UPI00340400B3
MTNVVRLLEPLQEAVGRDPHGEATRDRLTARQRPVATLTFCDDQAIKERLASAEYAERRALVAAELEPDDPDFQALVAAAQDELADARAAFTEAAIVLRFQGLRRKDFTALKRRHPATEDQAANGLDVNPETFDPALIAACSLDGITAEDAAEYLADWTEGEALLLFNTAYGLQGSDARAVLGDG